MQNSPNDTQRDVDAPAEWPGLPRLWFGLSAPVGARAYTASGFTLMAFKYAVEAGLIWSLTGRVFTPQDFLNPLLSMRQAFFAPPAPLYEVVTTVEIDAPPENVWPHVIGFSDLPDPDPWYFRLGIAYPKRAKIKGAGVGAVRHCEFSTGSFVEPITATRACSHQTAGGGQLKTEVELHGRANRVAI